MPIIFRPPCPVSAGTSEVASDGLFCRGPAGDVKNPPPTVSRPDMMLSAGVAELVDALDLGSSDESCGGSSPSARTIFSRESADDLTAGVVGASSQPHRWIAH